ncbi:hypothetical protein BDP55DRAFT_722421 [Colletotrichum godetiae]|uniref:Cupin 2 conserved barrel domain-containing protein n=1 Tax=Colletotrichum godetiae TaxID=1209918 RepID=A0AAJ0AZQ0_9PEZI|nr:uncharacterized protein BDP55DRAFT_722421 [Colletotrichum godetiae]KAK1701180.1 hypothetical protein BDP55DRAFT_722421 [Colletotrichum godetiae]
MTRPRETVKVIYDYKLANAEGKSIVGLEVTYPPNSYTPPHRHAGAAVVVNIVEGSFLSGMNGNPPNMYEVGEGFMELPGCHHTVGENPNSESRVVFVAVFIVNTKVLESGYEALTVLDEGY